MVEGNVVVLSEQRGNGTGRMIMEAIEYDPKNIA